MERLHTRRGIGYEHDFELEQQHYDFHVYDLEQHYEHQHYEHVDQHQFKHQQFDHEHIDLIEHEHLQQYEHEYQLFHVNLDVDEFFYIDQHLNQLLYFKHNIDSEQQLDFYVDLEQFEHYFDGEYDLDYDFNGYYRTLRSGIYVELAETVIQGLYAGSTSQRLPDKEIWAIWQQESGDVTMDPEQTDAACMTRKPDAKKRAVEILEEALSGTSSKSKNSLIREAIRSLK